MTRNSGEMRLELFVLQAPEVRFERVVLACAAMAGSLTTTTH
jgi:hypothetical protein